MDREVVEKVKKYAEVVRKDMPVKMVISGKGFAVLY